MANKPNTVPDMTTIWSRGKEVGGRAVIAIDLGLVSYSS